MSLNVANAVKYLDEHAQKASTKHCAAFVREALQAGGLFINPHPVKACDYGPASRCCTKQVAGVTVLHGSAIRLQQPQPT